MEELFIQVLFAIAQIIFELILELAGEALADVTSRAVGEVYEPRAFADPMWAVGGYAVLGAIAGGISLLAFPHPFFRASRIHGISMLISPIITGGVMAMVGWTLRRHGKEPTRIESFGYGFAFALGMSVVRFLFAQ